MKRTLWITGYGGFVAGHAVRLAPNKWEVHALARRPVPPINPEARYHQLGLHDPESVSALFAAHTPHALIHCAAIADIDYCQRNPEEADKINADVTERLARLCAQHGTRMVFCSTDTVFDGEHGNYTEDDKPNPVNHYGATKVRAEGLVSSVLTDHVIARVALVMGLPATGSGNAFLAKLMQNARAGKPTPFPSNELRTPIDVVSLALALLELAERQETGTVHLAGNTRLNRYDMGCRIAAHMGYPAEMVTAVNSNEIPGRARRPDDVSLNNGKARRLLSTPMRDLIEGLDLVLAAMEGTAP